MGPSIFGSSYQTLTNGVHHFLNLARFAAICRSPLVVWRHVAAGDGRRDAACGDPSLAAIITSLYFSPSEQVPAAALEDHNQVQHLRNRSVADLQVLIVSPLLLGSGHGVLAAALSRL